MRCFESALGDLSLSRHAYRVSSELPTEAETEGKTGSWTMVDLDFGGVSQAFLDGKNIGKQPSTSGKDLGFSEFVEVADEMN